MLFHSNQCWEKKFGDLDVDVSMGWYDGAEIYELVLNFIINKLSNIINKNNINTYRDDGLGVFDKLHGPQIK